ncbi:ATP-binding cassette domain-containing protein [Filifactor villosus]|uniref:ATP-binding cassette domain-containing protein n=2 Tax=Filifactor villosus TaxID=29374 RepID=A0ABV9QMJ9_9FIRM
MEKIIELKGVNYFYKTFKKQQGFVGSIKDFWKREEERVHSLRNFELEIDKGEILGLLGPNGAGKTTLIKLLSGILEPDSGEVSCMGHRPFRKEKAYLKNIGVVLGQKSQLIWDLPALETLDMLRLIYEVEKSEYEQRLELLLDLLELKDKLHIPVRKLSLGERVKFELICALIHRPEVLFLDEPTIGLDLTSQRNIHRFLKEINRKERITVLLTSHYLKDIEALCERIVIVMKGQKKEDTSIRALVEKFSGKGSEFVIEFTDFVPEGLHMLGEVRENSLEVSDKVLEDLLTSLPIDKVESVKRKRKSFDEVIYQIYSGD